MRFARAMLGISVTVCVIGVTAIGQQEEAPHQPAPKTRLELCMAAMPMIFKNYNNAKYAVFRARILTMPPFPVEAQAALDAIEQPLKDCYEASQNTHAEQKQDSKQ